MGGGHASFLAGNVPITDRWGQLKIGMGLINAFKGLDYDARQALSEFSAPFGLDVSGWQNNPI